MIDPFDLGAIRNRHGDDCACDFHEDIPTCDLQDAIEEIERLRLLAPKEHECNLPPNSRYCDDCNLDMTYHKEFFYD